ncbi:MAG: cytochrome P450 [Myxococcota bacterium]
MSAAPRSALVAAGALAFDPERFLAAEAARQGDPFVLRLPGASATWVTGVPEGARAILGAPRDAFTCVSPNPIEPLLGPASLILVAGDRHARGRRLLVPAFAGARVREASGVVHAAALRERARLWRGAVVDLVALAQALTLDVILEVVLGATGARAEALRDDALAWLARFTPPLLLAPFLRRPFGGLGPWARFRRRWRAFDARLDAEIDRHAPDAPDVLGLLLAVRDEGGAPLPRDEVKDQVRTLLVAGHETAAIGIARAVHAAVSRPEVGARVRAELAAGPDALLDLPYLGALCDEALRRHPVVPVVLRRVSGAFALLGREVPAGDNVAVALPLLHAHAATWGDPEAFRPERFLERAFAPHEYAPFGGAHRRCIGAEFARMEMRVAVGTLLARTRLVPVGEPEPRTVPRNIVHAPAGGLRVRVES